MAAGETNGNHFTEGEVAELAIFSLPPTQTGVQQCDLVEYRPTSSLSNDAPVEFNIPSSSGDYIDLRKCRLYVKGRLLRADGSERVRDDTVAPGNQFLQSLWSQIDVSVQGQLVSTGTGNYPYKANIQTELSSGEDVRRTQLESQIYAEEAINGNLNTGQNTRRLLAANLTTSVECEGPLHEDFFRIGKYFLNGCNIHLRLYRSRAEFHLETKNTDKKAYKFVIEECVFKVAYVKLNPAVIIAHSKALQQTTAKYPLHKTVLKSTTALQNQLNFVWDAVFQNNVPEKLVVALVAAETFAGTFDKSPFDYRLHNLSRVSVFVDGQNVSGSPLKVSETNYTTAFVNMFDAIGTWNTDAGNGIDLDNFRLGRALFVFSLSPNFPDQEYLNLPRRGNLRIELQFSTALSENVNVLVYGEFPGLLEVDEARNVIFSNISA